MYLSDDFHPFLWKTTDYGKTWKKIVNGIPADDFTRAIRPDPKPEGPALRRNRVAPLHLLQRRRQVAALPAQPAQRPGHRHCLPEARRRMVLATQGRGFYVLDDMPLVRALDPAKFS
jgi:hypothetical protein